MKKLTMMWALLATVLLSVVGCNDNGQEQNVKKPTISVAEAVVNAETMKASIEVTPSSETATWSWKVDTAEAAGEYTVVKGNAKTTIEVEVEYDVEYTFTAFAKNTAGESAPVSVTFVGPEAPVDIATPTVEVSEVTVDAENLKATATVTPSETTTKWYYALTEGAATAETTYTEVEGAEAKELSFDIAYDKSYTLTVYAVNVEGDQSEKVAKTFEGPKAPAGVATVAVGEVAVDAENLKATVTVTPSETTAKWYYTLKDDITTEVPEATETIGYKEATLTFDIAYDRTYILQVWAVNEDEVKSEVVTKTFEAPKTPVDIAVPTITLGEVTVDAETLKATVTVTPSETTAKWYYALKDNVNNKEEYTEVEGAEAKTLSLDVAPGVKYILLVYAVNAEDEKSEVARASFDGPAKTDEEPSGNGELVKLELKNITSLSVDADVLKYKECVKYVAGAVFTEAYNEARFITAAKNSLNPNESYPYVQYNSATASKVWTEMDLVKNGLTTKVENDGIQIIAGMSYTVAVYAEDAEGNSKVYTQEFTAPAAKIDGNVDLKMNIDEIGMTDVTATFTASTDCRIIAGTRLVTNQQDGGFDVNSMSADEVKAFLVANAAAVPHMFQGKETIKFVDDMGIDTDYIVYAIAIKDGKIGDVVFEKFHTKRPELTGKGAITSATFETQTDINALTYSLTTNADAKKVRVYFTTSVDYNNNKATLDFIMISEEASYMWKEYEVKDGKVEITDEVYVPGNQYAVIAMAFDAEGTPGPLTNLVQLWDSSLTYYKTLEEIVEPSKIDMTGTGEVALIVKEGGVTAEVAAATISAGSKSDNVDKAWLFYFNEEMEKNIETAVFNNLQEWDGTTESIFGAVKDITFAEGESFVYESMIPYDQGWGGTIVAAVTLDKDGKFNVSDYYLAGTGDKGVDAPVLTPTGDAILNVKELVNNEGMVNVKTQITKVNEAFEFGWLVRFAEIKESELSEKIAAGIKEYGSTGMITGAVVEEITFDAVKEYNFLTAYSDEWGGSILAVVGMDNEGNVTLADYYKAGTGDKGTVNDGGDTPEPGTDVFPALYKGATLSLLSEDTTDDVNASATLKVSDIPAGYSAWMFNLGAAAKPANVITDVAAKFEDGVPSENNVNRKVEAGTEVTFTNLATEWKGEVSVIALVLVDAENKPWVVAAYACGKGVSPEGTLEIGQGGGDDPIVDHKPAMAIVSEDVTDPASASVTLSVNGIGADYTGWLINLGSEALVDEVDSKVAALFADGEPTASAMGAYRKVENGSENAFQYMMTYHPTYGGNIIAFVVVDAQGNASVVNYYVCGEGLVGGTTTEAPAMALVSENVSAGTATFTVSNLPAEGTAWLLNLGDDAQPNEVSSKVALLFAEGDPIATENGAYRKVAEGTEYTYNSMLPYEEQYGGNIIVLVVVKDGVPTVYNYYTCGVGMSGSESEDDGEDVGFGGGTPSYGEIDDDVNIGGGTPSVGGDNNGNVGVGGGTPIVD